MHVKMKVTGLMMDPITNMPIVVLKGDQPDQVLPIWVGVFEANAIALKKENIATPRPMTHDLLNHVIARMGAKILRILVNELKDNTFYAIIFLSYKGEEIQIDSRPSDAIALALRAEAPIYVEQAVLEKASSPEFTKQHELVEEKIRKWFENVDPEDFSKYEM
jgi:bifunctional DNase/RNase